ncbi:MAG TPA: FAD-dependent oxidoreductase [Burkholderiales bacterium]|nr:FAD-dependent oxidoreductase [Burkholderiales bacterium]
MEPASDENAYGHIGGDTADVTLPPSVATRRDQVFPKLKPAEIDRLRRFGTLKTWNPGEFLFEAGVSGMGMFVLLRGRVLITYKDSRGQHVRAIEHGPGHFLAEVGSLSGRPPLVYGRAVGAVEALVIDPPSLRAVLIAEAELGERIMRALILRRVALFETGTGGPVIIGTPGSARVLRLQGFLSRNAHPHTVLDAARDRDAEPALKIHAPRPEELPLVMCPDGTVLKRPTEQALARVIGLLPELSADRTYDVAIVGAGPSGLSAAVYAASQGLSVVVLEARVIGGQIGASARIENYLGFPTGIAGAALAGRAIVQAQKFGVDFAVPTPVTRLECAGFPLRLHVEGGMCVAARTAVIATGAKYRRPDIPNLANYEGRGVHYWASQVEAALCRGEEVVLVGGGNSAGQAAAFLAGHAVHVHILIRGVGLESTMSTYLIERIAALGNVTLHVESEIVALEGGRKDLTGVRWRDRRRGTEVAKPIRRVFLFVGADPNTGWLGACGVKLDDKGFIATGAALPADEYSRAARPAGDRQPLPLETAVPGVFAIGDARAGSNKQVTSAVGEGAAVVAQVHAWLAQAGGVRT